MYNALIKTSKTLIKWVMIIGSFLSISYLFSLLSTVHGKELPEEYFSNGHPVIIGLFDSEFFMGLIFLITFSVIAYVLYLLWQLHEIAVHKAEKQTGQPGICTVAVRPVFTQGLVGHRRCHRIHRLGCDISSA
ncbi:hypothetical protein [Vibrio mexicanus]|uniref:hypothetical protein n=1 Tax=Vibrio mexicanus TaxID=1004326 RepID=UPI000AB59AC6